MKNLLILLVVIAASIKFLPMEMLIVMALSPVGLAIGLPIARGVEVLIANR